MAEQTQLNRIPGHTGTRSWRALNSWDVVLLLAAVALVAAFCWRSAAVTRHDWNWSALWPYVVSRDSSGAWQAGMLLKGLFGTLRLGFWSLAVALVSGGLVGALSARQRGFAAWPATLYITVLRNTPPLVLLFLVYFLPDPFSPNLFSALRMPWLRCLRGHSRCAPRFSPRRDRWTAWPPPCLLWGSIPVRTWRK